jgi:hypothetical protein
MAYSYTALLLMILLPIPMLIGRAVLLVIVLHLDMVSSWAII